MDFGLTLPNYPAGASREGIDATAEAAERLGLSTVWTTDHLLVAHQDIADYGRIFEAILTLAWVGARYPAIRLGTSVIVVPMRNAIQTAKELATLDVLSGGRVIAGVGGGWSEPEFANLGVGDRYHVRGAYLEETIRLWRHLWSGRTDPFAGRFHDLIDFTFEPLPVQGGDLPIVAGGRVEAALRRAGAVADGYHASAIGPETFAQRAPIVRAAAEEAGRAAPWFSARVRVAFDDEPPPAGYSMHGSPPEIAAEVARFAALGVTHIAVGFGSTDPVTNVARIERFVRDVVPLVLAA